MTTLTEKIEACLPKTIQQGGYHPIDEGRLSQKMYEDMCWNEEEAKRDGFNQYRAEVIAAIPKIIQILKREIDNLPRYGTCEETGNKWAILEEDIESILK